MKFDFSFKNMQPEVSLQNYAQVKLKDKLDKLGISTVNFHITFETDKNQHIARCSFQEPHGSTMQAEDKSYDMHGSIDGLVDKVLGQLKKKKEKLKDHRAKEKIGTGLSQSKGRAEGGSNGEIDAEDILKYEKAKRNRNQAG